MTTINGRPLAPNGTDPLTSGTITWTPANRGELRPADPNAHHGTIVQFLGSLPDPWEIPEGVYDVRLTTRDHRTDAAGQGRPVFASLTRCGVDIRGLTTITWSGLWAGDAEYTETTPTHVEQAQAARLAAETAALTAQAAEDEAEDQATLAVQARDQAQAAAATATAPTAAQLAAVDADAASAFRQQQDARLSATFVSSAARTKHAPALGLFFPEAEGAVGDGVTDDAAAIQSAIDVSSTAKGTLVITGAHAVGSPLVMRDDTELDLLLGSRLIKTFNAAYLIAQSSYATKVQRVKIRGRGHIGSASHAVTGIIVHLFGDDIALDDFTINTYAGGQALLLGGDRMRLNRVGALNPADEAGAGGIRYFGGKNFRAYDCHIVSGDDALQFTPVASASAVRDQSIEDAYYIGCTGIASEGRSMVVITQTSPIGAGGLTCSIRDVGFIACSGSGTRRAITVSNMDSSADIDGVTFADCTLDQSAAPVYPGQEVRVEAGTAGGGTVRNVRFDRLHVIAPAMTAFGTGASAPNLYVHDVSLNDCILGAPRDRTATVVPMGVDGFRARGGTFHGSGGTHVISGSSGINASKNVSVVETTLTGIANSLAGVRLTATTGFRVRDVICKPATGATTSQGVSLAAASVNGIITGCDFTAIGGTSVAGVIDPSVVQRDNFG